MNVARVAEAQLHEAVGLGKLDVHASLVAGVRGNAVAQDMRSSP
jgi:hypothetical protein